MLKELESAEDMDIGGVSFERWQSKLHLARGDRRIVFRRQNRGVLGESSLPSTPSGPQTKLEKTNGNDGGRYGAQDSNKGLLSTGFLAHVLAQHTSMKIWQNRLRHDQ